MQENIAKPVPWLADDFMITPLAKFSIRGLVLHRKDYSSGKESDLSPVDFAMGWAAMSNQAVIDNLDISQRGRFYCWKTDRFPIPRKDIECSSANMHIIPADDDVREKIDDVYQGSVISMRGYLVKVTSDGNWRWISSMKRTDTGDGACEIVWVEDLVVENFD